MYLLMNENKALLSFDVENNKLINISRLSECSISYFDLEVFFRERLKSKGFKDRHELHLSVIPNLLEEYNSEIIAISNITNWTSDSDKFWVKSEKEIVDFETVYNRLKECNLFTLEDIPDAYDKTFERALFINLVNDYIVIECNNISNLDNLDYLLKINSKVLIFTCEKELQCFNNPDFINMTKESNLNNPFREIFVYTNNEAGFRYRKDYIFSKNDIIFTLKNKNKSICDFIIYKLEKEVLISRLRVYNEKEFEKFIKEYGSIANFYSCVRKNKSRDVQRDIMLTYLVNEKSDYWTDYGISKSKGKADMLSKNIKYEDKDKSLCNILSKNNTEYDLITLKSPAKFEDIEYLLKGKQEIIIIKTDAEEYYSNDFKLIYKKAGMNYLLYIENNAGQLLLRDL